jgi:hypothetical protein
MRAPLTPKEYPIPDLERFIRSGPTLADFRRYHPIVQPSHDAALGKERLQFYAPRQLGRKYSGKIGACP